MQTTIVNHEQYLDLTLENWKINHNIQKIQALIDTGCNADLLISTKLAKLLELEIYEYKHRVVKFADGKEKAAKVADILVSFPTLDYIADFEAKAFVHDKENWLSVEVGNKLLSKFCVNNKLIMEFDYYENLVQFKSRK